MRNCHKEILRMRRTCSCAAMKQNRCVVIYRAKLNCLKVRKKAKHYFIAPFWQGLGYY
ncbi:hypothetical protein HFN_2354 [Helicobacter fennelliae MRY12-0050]|uniref:Uncharacterized protein n=1 Tax=Helicobacter fennelliae MRY12-0050 TaxID=1325130 RepID=T1CZT1_9HELI|nr:hypothetical protein HFN_2354 [Helicobacter fennelliae MRY12-0050]